jgi:hypothetical protein
MTNDFREVSAGTLSVLSHTLSIESQKLGQWIKMVDKPPNCIRLRQGSGDGLQTKAPNKANAASKSSLGRIWHNWFCHAPGFGLPSWQSTVFGKTILPKSTPAKIHS